MEQPTRGGVCDDDGRAPEETQPRFMATPSHRSFTTQHPSQASKTVPALIHSGTEATTHMTLDTGDNDKLKPQQKFKEIKVISDTLLKPFKLGQKIILFSNRTNPATVRV